MLKSWFLVLIFATALVATVHGQTEKPYRAHGAPWRPTKWAWTTEEWTGNNLPYRDSRVLIDRIGNNAPRLQKLLEEYEAAAAKKPFDPLAQYRWGYSVYQAATGKVLRSSETRANIEIVAAALEKAPSPHVYEYARLRFLIEMWQYPKFEHLTIGKRLVKRDATDRSVKYFLTRILAWSRLPGDKQQALVYARELLTVNPQKASYHSLLGGVYLNLWHESRKREYAEKAIASYNKYLELAPLNDGWRVQAKQLIQMAKDNLAKQKTKGT